MPEHNSMYLAQIVNVAADERVLSEEGKITLSKFFPIAYDTSEYGYYALEVFRPCSSC